MHDVSLPMQKVRCTRGGGRRRHSVADLIAVEASEPELGESCRRVVGLSVLAVPGRRRVKGTHSKRRVNISTPNDTLALRKNANSGAGRQCHCVVHRCRPYLQRCIGVGRRCALNRGAVQQLNSRRDEVLVRSDSDRSRRNTSFELQSDLDGVLRR